MRKVIKRVLIAILAIVLVVAIVVGVRVLNYFRVSGQALDDKFHVFTGGGGNTAVLLTDEGAVVVDTKMWIGASRLHDELQRFGKVRAIVNTHHHLDHTHGNPLFPPGTDVYAAAPVADFLTRFDADFWRKEPAKLLMPNRLFRDRIDVDLGGETLRLVQLPASHTGGGDSAVLFVERKIVHTGDVVVNGLHPRIDVESGGSVLGAIKAVDEILELDFVTAVPGHGPVGNRDDVHEMRAYYVALVDHSRAALTSGWSAREAEKNAPAALQGRTSMTGLSSLSRNLEAAMSELKKGG
jgi:glyoxylase-like metal-dependent hydrolase (beta-lactamase superfamily II)